METGILIAIGLGVGLAITLLIESSREWLLEGLEEGWDAVLELFSSAFDDMGEISYYGIGFGILGAGVVYLSRNYLLNAFLVHMTPFGQIFWGALTYIGTFAAGYFVGKGFENT